MVSKRAVGGTINDHRPGSDSNSKSDNSSYRVILITNAGLVTMAFMEVVICILYMCKNIPQVHTFRKTQKRWH